MKKQNEKTLEEKIKETFPLAKKPKNLIEFDCIVVPMSRSELASGRMKTLIKTIKEYEQERGYGLEKYSQSSDAFSLYFEKGESRHDITIDGLFPGQVNIYYSEEEIK